MMRGFFLFLFLSFSFFASSRLIYLIFCFISHAAIPISKEGLFCIVSSQRDVGARCSAYDQCLDAFSNVLENQTTKCLDLAARHAYGR